MKKLFDFNSENFILDKLGDWLQKKIYNKVMAVIVSIVLGIAFIGLYFGFFIMPFFTYDSLTVKIIFTILWVLSCGVIVIALVDDLKKQSTNDKWGLGIITGCFIVFFGLCFVNNNYYYLGTWWQIAIVCVMLLFTIMMIYSFIKELIKNPKDTLASLLMGVLLVFGFLCILGSSLDALEMTERKWLLIIGSFCVGLPIVALMIAYILGISKPKKVMEYGSLVIFCILVLIGISSIISFLNPEINGYQTFVTLLASLLGGGLTLVGVAWTIKDGNYKRQKELERMENERKEEERKKYRPILNLYLTDENEEGDIIEQKEFLNVEGITFKKNYKCIYSYYIYQFNIKNTDFTSFFLKGLRINNINFSFKVKHYIDKNMLAIFSFGQQYIFLNQKIETLSIEIEDLLGNIYFYPLSFKTEFETKEKRKGAIENAYTIEVFDCGLAEFSTKEVNNE